MSQLTDKIEAAIALMTEALALEVLGVPEPPYHARTDRDTLPKPPLPTLGPAGFAFQDPTFGSRLLRVTDGVSRPGRSYDAPSNTHLAAWSADGRRFSVMGPDGFVMYDFNADDFTVKALTSPYTQTEPTWSRTDPHALYVVDGPISRTVTRHDIALGTGTQLLDLDTLGLPGLVEPRTYVGSIMAAGDPEVVAVSYGGQGQGGHYLVTVIHPDGRLQHLNTVERADCHLHSLGMDLSGRYVALYPNNAQPCQVIFWDLQTDTLHNETVSMYGHDALGFGVQTNMCPLDETPWDARQWVLRSLADIDHPSNLIAPVLVPEEQYTADHQSWNHAQRETRVPVISSTFRTADGQHAPWLPWIDEILAVSTDGSGTVYRFAHHRSDPSDGFWSQPIIHVSPDGKFAIFSSNWEKTLGVDTNEGGHRNDVFLVELK